MLSLAQRCYLFEQSAQDRILSVSRLRSIYKSRGIVYKNIQVAVKNDDTKIARYAEQKLSSFEKLTRIARLGGTIYFVDEAVFTS